jgi:hypothetical protein
MRKSEIMRRRTLILIFFPGMLFLWIIGWSLYWIGDSRARNKQDNKKQPIKIQAVLNLQEHEIPQ